MIKIQEIK